MKLSMKLDVVRDARPQGQRYYGADDAELGEWQRDAQKLEETVKRLRTMAQAAQVAVDEYEKADDGEWTGSPLDRAWAELKRQLARTKTEGER